MAINFVSEVDRKFFSNNMLTTEDWDLTSANTDLDFSDLISDEKTITETVTPELPDQLQIPMEEGFSTIEEFPILGFHDDLWYEHSDSSDSGIGGELKPPSPGVEVKQEPMSPASSIGSDSCDKSQYFDLYGNCVLEKVPPTGPDSHIFTIPQTEECHTHITPKQEFLPSTVLQSDSELANINTIISSKIKIQPKLPAQLQPNLGAKEEVEPLVLTATEFAELTSKGLLKFNNPSQELPQTSYSTAPSTSTVGQVVSDIKHIRRQQRMIKNRESASLSRKRKKEYLSCLEIQLNDFLTENQKLKEENEKLKMRVTALQTENQVLKKTTPLTPAKKICLMAVVLFLSFNALPWIGISEKTNSRDMNAFTSPHRGRQLLSVPGFSEGYDNWPISSKPHLDVIQAFLKRNAGTISYNGTEFPLHMCPTYINSTESVKVAEQLAGWMMRHEEEKQKKAKKRSQKSKPGRPSVNTLRATVQGDTELQNRDQFRSNDFNYEMQLYGGSQSEHDFLQKINRRNDTFYVLSFSSDYFLVPASAHNKTMRPRMSLVMPATSLNESMAPPVGSVGMMQIDCEVTGTQLIHIQKSAIPKHVLRKNTTFTAPGETGDRLHFP
ncbi:hypothetical protein ScPMuIL_010375 [Solemya velum]